MPTIPQKELRNHIADVLRRAPGEEVAITVAGWPVVQLGPAQRRRWVRGVDLGRLWETPAPETLIDDLDRFPAELSDQFD